jgi:glycogen(starch) synthase
VAIRIPILGKYVFGPYLRFCWRLIRGTVSNKDQQNDSSYAAAISSLKMHVSLLESRQIDLQEQVSSLRWKTDLRSMLELAALNGVRARLSLDQSAPPIERRGLSIQNYGRYTFSIIVNTYNRAHTLERTLASLLNLRHLAYEVIVVNGPSTDATSDILDRYRHLFKIGHCEEVNLSISRNIGIRMSEGDIVCFLDDDAVPEPNWLNELELGYSSEKVAAVGGYIRDHTGVSYQCRALTCNRFGEGSDNESPEKAIVSSDLHREVFFSLTGTNCSFRRDILIAIGGFDEEFAYFLDETDVIVRLIDAGFQAQYVPSAEIHHKYAASHLRDTDKVPKSIYTSAKSKAYFCLKNATVGFTMADVFSHIESYRQSLRAAYDWYLIHGKIEPAHHRALHEGIDRGIIDGITHSFRPRKLLDASFSAGHHGVFRPVRPVRHPVNRIRICFLSREYPPDQCGGIGVWTHELAVALARTGHEVSVVALATCGHPTVDLTEGVWVHRIVPKWQPARIEPELPDVAQVVKDYAYTVYDEVMRISTVRGLDCVSSPIWDLEGLACIAAKSIPTILSLHSCFGLVLPYKSEWLNNEEYLRNHVYKMMKGEAWALESAGVIFANSRAIVNDIEKCYALSIPRERIELIPHGISIESPEKTSVTKDFGDSQLISVLFVGRFEKRKGIDLLLKIIPTILQQFQNVKFELVGDHTIPFDDGRIIMHEFRDAFKNEPWMSRVVFSGFLTDLQLREKYRECDIFVAPSRYESFGLILLEAMRAAKPCVCSNIGGMAEVVVEGETGLIVDPDDFDALRTALVRLIESKDERLRMGQNGFNRFLDCFTTEIMISRFETGVFNFLESLTSEGPGDSEVRTTVTTL